MALPSDTRRLVTIQWLIDWTFHKGMTVAGTAQDLHLIPFYAKEELPGITKTPAKVRIFFLSAKTIFKK